MKRLLAWTFAAVFVLPLLIGGAALSEGEEPTGFTERGGGGDEAQASAAPPELRPVFIAAARRFVLPPALLVAVAEITGDERSLMGLTPSEWSRFGRGDRGDAQEQVDAAARLLLAAGAAGDGGWDAARGLAGYTTTAGRVGEVLALAAEYGYRYRADGPPLDPDRYVFPLVGDVTYGPHHHDYPATDIFAAIGVPVVAVTRSVVLRASPTEVGKGGITATLPRMPAVTWRRPPRRESRKNRMICKNRPCWHFNHGPGASVNTSSIPSKKKHMGRESASASATKYSRSFHFGDQRNCLKACVLNEPWCSMSATWL